MSKCAMCNVNHAVLKMDDGAMICTKCGDILMKEVERQFIRRVVIPVGVVVLTLAVLAIWVLAR